MKISSIILTKNEEKNILSAVHSLDFSSEVIVVDDFSTDRTADVAEKAGAVVIKRRLGASFADQRNAGLTRAKGEWVFFMDADERVSPKLKKELLEVVRKKSRISAYKIARQDIFLGRKMKYGELGNAKFVRLAKRNIGEWTRGVHEYWKTTGSVGYLKNSLIHYPHPTLYEFISDINFNSTLHAIENRKEQKESSTVKVLFWPKLKFVSGYFFRRGYKDGMHGLVFALIMSFHSFLAWSKVWISQKNLLKNR